MIDFSDVDEELAAKEERMKGELWRCQVPEVPPVVPLGSAVSKVQPELRLGPEVQLAPEVRPGPEVQHGGAVSSILARLDLIESRVSSPSSSHPSVDQWLQQIIAGQDRSVARKSFSIRLSSMRRAGLERAQVHRGHSTIADALDEALAIGLTGMMKLPFRSGVVWRFGRKRKSN